MVEGLPKEKIDGVCIWLDPNTPVIAMSIRFDRIDNFWFVLWHEIAHVLNRDGKNESAWIIDIELEKSEDTTRKVSKQEHRANEAAGDVCSANQELFSALAGRTYYAERDFLTLAQRFRIHPGILIGQIQKKIGRWELLRKYLVRVREHLMPTATVDGWGHIIQVSL